jgi:Gas vesicle synthesis protein GvpL/GvpF
MAEPRAVWLYAVAEHPLELAELGGVDGAPVRTISAEGLAAVASDVALDEFGESALRANLEDLSWLEATATAHHSVIDAVSRVRPAVPMRLATVYSEDGSVRAMLAERGPDVRAVLARTSTCQEWGVKVYAAPPAESSSEAPAPASGADYLRRRRTELDARADSQRKARANAEHIHAVLGHHAAAGRLHPPQSPKLSGTTAAMILNAAYLVPVAGSDAFATAVQELAGESPAVQLHLTGPWPPYSFATLEQEPGEHALAAR